MQEDLREKASKILDDLLEGVEFSAQAFRSPYGLLYNLTGLEFLIGHSPRETSTNGEPPRCVREGSEIIPIDEFLGLYDPKQRKIVIFNKAIQWASKELKCQPELLRHIVRIHEWAHAIIHLGVDEEVRKKVSDNNYDSRVIDNILQNQGKTYESTEHKLHEVLAQILTYHSLRASEERATRKESKFVTNKMIELFSELGKRQPHEYRLNGGYLNIPFTKISQSICLIKKGWLKGIFDAWSIIVTW